MLPLTDAPRLTVRATALQELLLRRESFQHIVLHAFNQQHSATVASALRPPPHGGFDSLDYYVDGQSRQVLQFAALHAVSAHIQAGEVLAPAQLLPQVPAGRAEGVGRPANCQLELR